MGKWQIRSVEGWREGSSFCTVGACPLPAEDTEAWSSSGSSATRSHLTPARNLLSPLLGFLTSLMTKTAAFHKLDFSMFIINKSKTYGD
jgi:hypothetical protein